MTSTANSIDQGIIVGLLAGVITTLFAFRSRGLASRVFLILLSVSLLVPSAILCVGRNPWLVDARFRSFQFLYWNIRIGMNREEVIEEMRKAYPAGQIPEPPRIVTDSATGMKILMNPGTSGEPGQEAIILKLEEGLIMKKDYSADRSSGT